MLALACPKYSANAENIHYITFDTAAEQKLSPIRETLLLTCIEDVNHPDDRNSLMITAQNGLEDGTRLLLDKNVDTNAKDKSGSTALHHATKSGNEAIVKLLLSRGSDRNVKDKSGRTALQYTTKCRNKNIIKLLLDQQVQKNAKNQSGRTALHHAMKKGYEDIVRPLLGGGVDQKVKNKSGRTALRHATKEDVSRNCSLSLSPTSSIEPLSSVPCLHLIVGESCVKCRALAPPRTLLTGSFSASI